VRFKGEKVGKWISSKELDRTQDLKDMKRKFNDDN